MRFLYEIVKCSAADVCRWPFMILGWSKLSDLFFHSILHCAGFYYRLNGCEKSVVVRYKELSIEEMKCCDFGVVFLKDGENINVEIMK